MTIQPYLVPFRRAFEGLKGGEKRKVSQKSPSLISLTSLNSRPAPPQNIEATDPVGNEINELNEISPPLNSSISFNSYPAPYANALDALERHCPDHVPVERWQRCVEDG